MDDVYGRGMRYPSSLSGSGGVADSSGSRKVEESIRIILGTQYGERVMRPRFGCNLKTLAFAPNNPATASLARYYVSEGLRLWEPRIEVVDVAVDNDNSNSALIIQITYRLRSTQTTQSLVYPYYLEPAA